MRQFNVGKSNVFFVAVNIGISAFSFLKSFIFMKVLDLRELGIISLVQTIFMFIGLLQMGLLNGGYRIVSLGKKEDLEKTNNTIYSYLLILLPIGLLFCFLSYVYDWIDDISPILLIISVVFGVLTLLNNWFQNVLIGEQKLTEVNWINIVSISISLIMLPLPFCVGFWGAMWILMIQPLVFVLVGLWRNDELRPTGFMFSKVFVRYILSFGFIPFLGNIFSIVYLQVERWSVADVLGVEALGGFYLVFLYVSLYQLIPSSVNAIFFPKGVKAYADKRFGDFKRVLRYYYGILVGYGLLIVFVTRLLLEPFVSLLFPIHLPGVTLVYLILPGLIAQSLSEPIGLILNSSVILRPMLVVGASNLLFNIIVIIFLILMAFFSLENIAILRSVSGFFTLFGFLIAFIYIKNRLFVCN